jgi:hypothetical protein
MLLSAREKQYSFSNIQIAIKEERHSEPYSESWNDLRQGKVNHASYYAVLKLPSEEVIIAVSSQRLPLIHNPVVQTLCVFLNLPLEEVELK